MKPEEDYTNSEDSLYKGDELTDDEIRENYLNDMISKYISS